jgi:hypothetical protein
MMLLPGCDKASGDPPVITAPDLQDYSKPVQSRAADELEAIGLPPCSPQQVEQLDKCSAIKLMMPQYLRLRDKVRALDEANQ